MKLFFFVPFAILVGSAAFAGTSVQTNSPSFGKGECSIAALNADGKTHYKIIKQDTLAKLNQKQPKGKASEDCSKELKADLKITAESCQIFCYPN